MLSELFKYKQWSDRRTVAAIKNVDTHKYVTQVSFMLQQLNHMVIVEDMFRSRLLSEKPIHDFTNTLIVPCLSELEKRIELSNSWYLSYVSEVETDEILTEKIKFTFSDGKGGTLTRNEILFHIVNHGTYHRGAIGHELDLCLVPHPADTYTVYIHELEPSRR